MDKKEKQQMLLCVAHSGGVGGRKYLYIQHTHIAIGKREKRDFHSYVRTHTHFYVCSARTHAREKEERRGAASAGDVENQVVL